MATGDVWKCVMLMKWGTVECRPGFYLIEGAGGGGLNPAEDVSLAVQGAVAGSGLTGFSDQLQWYGNTIVDIQPGTSPTQTFNFGIPAVGTIEDTNPLPPQSAAVITWRTAVKPVVGAFAAQGRVYMPGIPQTGQISGFLEVDFQVALNGFAEGLFSTFVEDGTAYQLHVVSLTPNSKPVTIRAVNPVTTYSINNVVRSQRRREFGVGQ